MKIYTVSTRKFIEAADRAYDERMAADRWLRELAEKARKEAAK